MYLWASVAPFTSLHPWWHAAGHDDPSATSAHPTELDSPLAGAADDGLPALQLRVTGDGWQCRVGHKRCHGIAARWAGTRRHHFCSDDGRRCYPDIRPNRSGGDGGAGCRDTSPADGCFCSTDGHSTSADGRAGRHPAGDGTIEGDGSADRAGNRYRPRGRLTIARSDRRTHGRADGNAAHGRLHRPKRRRCVCHRPPFQRDTRRHHHRE